MKDINEFSPSEVWYKLCNNHFDIDYTEAINYLLDFDFDPFNSFNLLESCLESISNNKDFYLEDNLPKRFYLYIDYYQQLKNSYISRNNKYYN